MSLVDYLALMGAVAGVARLLTKEHGPMGILQKYRDFVSTHVKNEEIEDLLLCPFCLTVWFSLIFYAVWWFVPVTRGFILPLGIIGWTYTLLAIQGYTQE